MSIVTKKVEPIVGWMELTPQMDGYRDFLSLVLKAAEPKNTFLRAAILYVFDQFDVIGELKSIEPKATVEEAIRNYIPFK